MVSLELGKGLKKLCTRLVGCLMKNNLVIDNYIGFIRLSLVSLLNLPRVEINLVEYNNQYPDSFAS